ncbi:DEAD/DEAH box helicase [Denitrificimonas sp. JX-1]|uniref:DEAD/DEAH box helicase n=1 Tax=Denitrificimonas halotolerans TaxID=3098930 RepID=A0ABU5GVE5_9GAMM|nr:DEAD/DEAH box helicase [Denitrificimonas sp. JX-1]MDY7220261.1 DEAD/DEAH box helicase [Denitrificimonas sp. JX-1]
MSFTSLGLMPALLVRLQQLKYLQPTAVQRQTIATVLDGKDVLAAAQTGTGKTAAFSLPVLQILLTQGSKVAPNCVRALVLVPTRELAEQVHQSIRTYLGELPLRTAVAYGGVSINPQMMQLRRGVDVLVATPGRLLDLYQQNAVRFHQMQILVLDEADRMLDLGFAKELNALFSLMPQKRQTLLFSATFSGPIRTLAGGLLHEPVRIDVTPKHSAAESVKQYLIVVDKKDKTDLFLHLLREREWGQVLVFVRTRKGAEVLQKKLNAAQVSADAIHGDKTQPARLRALEDFKAGHVQVLVATDVAARGLDIEQLPQVVNFDLPTVAQDYVHRIGRTGRAGLTGEAVSLVSADELDALIAIEELLGLNLRRFDEPEFYAEHRLPETSVGVGRVKKPKKTKKNKAAAGQIHLGDVFAAEGKPRVVAVRQLPKLAVHGRSRPKTQSKTK